LIDEANRLLYVCSPYRGEVKRNKQYARELTRLAIDKGFLPVTVHLYITEATDDNNEADRAIGMRAGQEILDHCKYILIGGKYGLSQGMVAEIRRALDTGKIILTVAGENEDEISADVNVARLDSFTKRIPEGWMIGQRGGEWADMPTMLPAT